MNPNRYILDTNVIISAALQVTSLPRQALNNAQDDGIVMLSVATLRELSETLSRPKFERYLSTSERIAFLAQLTREAELVEISTQVQVCRDPRDDKFLELAVSGNATCLITGDQDLLVLHPFRSIAILTPRDFLAKL
jgi:uncharacterized protein